jgi:lipid-A-disaccharide synthase
MSSVLIIAGENSGEKYGAELVHEFKKTHPHIKFFGIGGTHMERESVDILYPVGELAVLGLVEILSSLPRIRKIFNTVKKEVQKKKPAAAVLIDSPDFNLRLAKRLKKLSVPVLYYISPTVWVWRKGRLKTIKKTVHRMMLIFPFEENIYRAHDIPAVYVGHPLIHKVKVALSREGYFKKLGIESHKKIISVLPGSRRSEIAYHMPILVDALHKINQEYEALFLLVLAEGLDRDLVLKHVPPRLQNVLPVAEDSYEAMAYSDMALSSCGTANLELALLETPFLAFYRLSPITYSFGIHLMKVNMYSIVNILAGSSVIPELIQKQFTPENVFQKARILLESEQLRKNMISQFRKIKSLLGDRSAPQNAAKELASLIRERTG